MKRESEDHDVLLVYVFHQNSNLFSLVLFFIAFPSLQIHKICGNQSPLNASQEKAPLSSRTQREAMQYPSDSFYC
jgi:hypothetical protein